MRRLQTPIVILLSLSAFGATERPSRSNAGPPAVAQPLIVHEWGTFTSVAGENGRAVDWRALGDPVGLPRFVERLRFNVKGNLTARIRMETPVLYFYAPRETTVDVSVRFHQGIVTEWFPRAAVTPTGIDDSALRRPDFSSSIAWKDVRVSPVRLTPDSTDGAKEGFPVDGSGSHYYRARETDASPLRVGSGSEKFLFYRGVGGFEPPISATVGADGRVVVQGLGGEAPGEVILFDNAAGMISYQVRQADGGQVVFDPPPDDHTAGEEEVAPPLAQLERMLVAHGLYPKEALAMIRTWRDAWFEEGTRLFYVVPEKMIDAILPLEIDPRPAQVARVFVGRVELVTPRVIHEVREAIARKDSKILKKYERFLQEITNRIRADRPAS
jgi:hypothetical protein